MPKPPTLIVTRGLPGSGKSHRAREWVEKNPAGRARVNRDDLRTQLHDGVHLGDATEQQIVAARDAMISRLLRHGVDVVCDETTLPQRTAYGLERIRRHAGARLEVWDLTNADLAVCITRDAHRRRPVGEAVIRSMHAQHIAGRGYPLPWPEYRPLGDTSPVLYQRPAGLPRAVLVDVDGTVSLRGDRSPYDESRVGEDTPNQPVIEAVRAMHACGYQVIFLSGRSENCRTATDLWLRQHVRIPIMGLYMRPAGDTRRDAVVKMEIFDRHIRSSYDVVAVFDDRRTVVDAWREIGLTVFAVAAGEF